jgi:PAT family beta-lactamase induction signal transducer AmpG
MSHTKDLPVSPRTLAHPLAWVPTLYLAMGLPNVMVNVVAAIVYKNMGVSNAEIALYTSQMALPWVLKPLWAPLLEGRRSQRWWVLRMQFLMAGALGAVAMCLPLEGFVRLSLAFFWIVGFASATMDTVSDGLFMATMPAAAQARYAGLQGMCWNLGAVLGSGLLVSLTGWLHNRYALPWVSCWMVALGLAAALMAVFGLWHWRYLPEGAGGATAASATSASPWLALRDTWYSFFTKPQIWAMLAVVFFYRFGEGFIERFAPLFLLDGRAVGGLGLDNQALGQLYGTAGTVAFIAGAFLGGFVVARRGLPGTLVLLALTLNLPHLTYYYLSHALPSDTLTIAAAVAIEKFGFGMGSVGQMLYMMQQLAPGPHRMAHYAMATGVMALTRWATGTLSGWVWPMVGERYDLFFTVALLASIPPVLLAWRAPFPQRSSDEASP